MPMDLLKKKTIGILTVLALDRESNSEGKNSEENNSEECNSEEEMKIATDGRVYNPPAYGVESNSEDVPKLTTPEIQPKYIAYPNTVWHNSRPLPKHAKTYELENFEKNLLIIINQKEINGYEPRLGTEKDVSALKNTFSQFGFEIEECFDKTKNEVLSVLYSFNYRNFSDYGCVAVVVLTHGSTNGLIRAKDDFYKESDIIQAFKTHDKPSLVTKPKLLIIQACRGEQSTKGVDVGGPSSSLIKKDSDCRIEPYILPVESDMYVLHSSYVGNPSYRHALYGSWLIQTLCKKINELAATHDLVSIVTDVKQEVAIDMTFVDYNTETLEFETNTQIPVETSSLIRKLYFRKFANQPISYADSKVEEIKERSIPSTPVIAIGPCTCFLDYFAYIIQCLRLYLDKNPEDKIAQYFVEAAEAFDETCETSVSRDKMTNAIVNYLSIHAKEFDFYKYIYFKK